MSLDWLRACRLRSYQFQRRSHADGSWPNIRAGPIATRPRSSVRAWPCPSPFGEVPAPRLLEDAHAPLTDSLDFVPPVTAPRATLLIRVMAGSVFLPKGSSSSSTRTRGLAVSPSSACRCRVHRDLRRWPRDCRWALAHPRTADARLRHRLHHRDDRRNPLDQDLALPRDFPVARSAAPPKVGSWAVMHETRSDFAQLLTCAFLLVVGPGPWSLDALLQKRWGRRPIDGEGAEPSRDIGMGTHVPVRT